MTPTPQPTGEDETRNAAPNEQPPVSPQPQPDPVLTAHDPTTVTADAAPRALRATSLDSDARVPTLDDVSAEAPEDDAPVTPEQAFDQRFLAAWRMRATDPSGAAFALDVLISSHSTPANRRPELMLHSAYAHRAAGELQAASRRLAQYLERFPGSPRAARVRQELRALRSGVAKPEDTPER